MVGESQEAVGVGGGAGPSSNKMPTLEEYGNNLTNQAKEVCPQTKMGLCFDSCRLRFPVYSCWFSLANVAICFLGVSGQHLTGLLAVTGQA